MEEFFLVALKSRRRLVPDRQSEFCIDAIFQMEPILLALVRVSICPSRKAKRRHYRKYYQKKRPHSDRETYHLIDADCRPAGDDAGTGAALNPRKLKRAVRRLLFLYPLPPTQASLVAGFG